MPSSSPNRRIICSSNRSIEVPNSNFQDDHMVTSSIESGLNDDALRELCLVLVTNNMIEDIESLFVTELEGLTLIASSSEILIRLSRINIILSVLDFHFRACLVHNLRKHLKKLSSELNSESTLIVSQQVIVALRSYMIFNYISALPEGLLHDIYGWLSIENYQSLMYVCKEWHQVARNETHWKIFYYAKFPVRNIIESEITTYFSAYRHRLLNPLVNDYVEIAWRGKFRLEGLDVYRGLAWWNAKIVDRHVSQVNNIFNFISSKFLYSSFYLFIRASIRFTMKDGRTDGTNGLHDQEFVGLSIQQQHATAPLKSSNVMMLSKYGAKVE